MKNELLVFVAISLVSIADISGYANPIEQLKQDKITTLVKSEKSYEVGIDITPGTYYVSDWNYILVSPSNGRRYTDIFDDNKKVITHSCVLATGEKVECLDNVVFTLVSNDFIVTPFPADEPYVSWSINEAETVTEQYNWSVNNTESHGKIEFDTRIKGIIIW